MMPRITFQDVLTHPAYKEHIQTISAEDVERMRCIVSVYDTCRRVRQRISRFGLSDIIKNNGHYKEYCWSDPSCNSGPDICVCGYLSDECNDILQLLEKLNNEDSTKKDLVADKKHGLSATLQRW